MHFYLIVQIFDTIKFPSLEISNGFPGPTDPIGDPATETETANDQTIENIASILNIKT